jgi:uncharacterized protein involved in exopolysaccharide biosynthesis
MIHDNERLDRDEGMSSIQMGVLLWQNKWMLIVTAAITVGISLIYVFTAADWYRADVLLKPADRRSAQGISSQWGGALASIAGIDLSSSNSVEPLAVLQSRELTGDFIEELHLLPMFFDRKWDASLNRWKSTNVVDQPDVRDGVSYFNRTIRKVQEDRKTGLVTLTIEWKDAKTAAAWANLLVERVNDSMRNRALAEAEYNVSYLKQELAATNVVTLQQSIGRVLESELQKLLLAKGNKEFAFRIIDHAQVPKYRAWPQRVVIVSIALIGGLAISIFFVLSRHVIRRNRALRSETHGR